MNEKPKSNGCWRWLRRGLIGIAVLITLAAVAVTEEDWRGKRAWENYRCQAEAHGERFDWLSYFSKPVPDDENFAKAPFFSSLYSQVWDAKTQTWKSNAVSPDDPTKMYPYYSDGFDDGDDGDWTQARLTRLEAWQKYYRHPSPKAVGEFPIAPQPQSPAADVLLALSKFDPAVEDLRVASRRPFNQFEIANAGDSKEFSLLLQYLAAYKRCTQLLRLRASAELADNQSARGLDDVQLLLRLDDELRQEPLLITQLVSMAIHAYVFQPIYEGLAQHRWNDAQLAELETSLARKDFLADFQMAMAGEWVLAFETMESRRITRKYQTVVDDGAGKSKTVTISFRFTPSAYFYQSELAFARVHEQFILPLADVTNRLVSPTAVRQELVTVSNQFKRFSPYKREALMTAPAVIRSVRKFAVAQSHTDLALVACALERYRLANGGYPESLDPLAPQYIGKVPHDIINGQPLHYRRTSDGLFVLYSVGWNEKDDGAQIVLTKTGSVDQNQGDWVWRYPAK
jgi:hypothetical protein